MKAPFCNQLITRGQPISRQTEMGMITFKHQKCLSNQYYMLCLITQSELEPWHTEGGVNPLTHPMDKSHPLKVATFSTAGVQNYSPSMATQTVLQIFHSPSTSSVPDIKIIKTIKYKGRTLWPRFSFLPLFTRGNLLIFKTSKEI